MKTRNLGTPPAILSGVKTQTTSKLAITTLLSIALAHSAFAAAELNESGSNITGVINSNKEKASESSSESAKSSSDSSESEGKAKVAVVDNTPDVSPVQSSVRPFNLKIEGPVYAAASDARSTAFQTNELPQMMKTINANLGEYKPLSNLSSKALDPAKLKLSTDSQVRVYFLGEGAGYHNTLGVNLAGIGVSSGDPKLIFPDASSRQSYLGGSATAMTRTSSEPLLAGDFVDLGTLKAGQKLDFFMIADGANGANKSRVWTASAKANSDGIQHMASFAVQDSAYLLLSFEDMTGGGDRDYNDLVFAVEIGAKNVAALANPEPHQILSFLLLGTTVYIVRRRMGEKTAVA